MQRFLPTIRVSVALACLTSGVLALAVGAGLVPDRLGAVLEGRKALCEQTAVHCALALQRGDLALARAALGSVTHRNPDLLSAALRDATGKLVVEAGDPTAQAEAPAGPPGVTHLTVPVVVQGRRWGQVEFHFVPPHGPLALAPFRHPALVLLAFVGVVGCAAYAVYLHLLFGQMGLVQSSIVPKRVRTTLNTLAEGVVVLDRDDRIVMANEAFAALVGESAGELQGRRVSDLPWTGPRGDGEAPEYPWARALVDGEAQTGSVLGLHGGAQPVRTLSINTTPILSDDGTPRGALATFDNLTPIEKKNAHLRKLLTQLKHSRTEIRRQNEELKLLATRDPLTGCLNRRAFFAEMETQWAAADRYGQALCCVMVDVDHFKAINDTHGHAVGDRVLQQVAETLRAEVRKTDSVCRYGGEEFCVLMPHVDLDDATQAAERLRQAIAACVFENVKVTASLGVSGLQLGPRDPHELLEQADKCLYAAKRGGRNRVVRWDAIRGTAAAEGPPAAAPSTASPAGTTLAIPFHAVTALLSALAYRHADTAEHSRRVADLCVAAARAMLTRTECYVLEVAAILHDIGKLGVPDAVLLKPGPLNADEWKVIRTHEAIGEEIIAAAFSSPELLAIIRHHHCWFGGSPHDPDLPAGDAIPVGARFLAIADAYDAMVSDRIYRKGRSREAAFAELRRCAGDQFDPPLVERFIAAVLARDENRQAALQVPKQTALKIGTQIERLAGALDANDHRGLATMATYLHATARAHGLAPIADAAARLEQAMAAPEPVAIAQRTLDLMDLCRATYHAYLPAPGDEVAV